MPRQRAETLEAIRSLQQLTELFGQRRRQLAREVDLTETQWELLEEVAEEHFMPSMFARQRSCSPAAVSRTLRQLQERGLVRASIGAEDARQRRYRLTARGRRLLERLRESRARAIAAIWEPFPAARLVAFRRFADELAERLERYLDER